MYIYPDMKSKAAIKRAIVAGETLTVQANGLEHEPPHNGVVTVEGPHYPKPHTWYGQAVIKDGVVVKIV